MRNTTCVSINNSAYFSKELIMLTKFRAIFMAFVVSDILCMSMLSDC